MIKISSPTRVDLAGGTLDMWPLSTFVKKAVTVNVAIDIQTYVELALNPSASDRTVSIDSPDLKEKFHFKDMQDFLVSSDPRMHYFQTTIRFFSQYTGLDAGFTLSARSDSPIGGGLGGSSSLMVSLLKSFYLVQKLAVPSVQQLVQIAHNLEAKILNTPTGTQDYIPAILGGINIIHYHPGDIEIETLEIDANLWEDHFLLVHTGRSHHSGLNNFEVLKNAVSKDRKTLNALSALSEISLNMAEVCRKMNIEQMKSQFGDLFAEEYKYRLQLAESFSSPEILKLQELALSFGIKSVKICGAGGGGCVLIWCQDNSQKNKIEEQCRIAGFSPMKTKPHPKVKQGM